MTLSMRKFRCDSRVDYKERRQRQLERIASACNLVRSRRHHQDSAAAVKDHVKKQKKPFRQNQRQDLDAEYRRAPHLQIAAIFAPISLNSGPPHQAIDTVNLTVSQQFW